MLDERGKSIVRMVVVGASMVIVGAFAFMALRFDSPEKIVRDLQSCVEADYSQSDKVLSKTGIDGTVSTSLATKESFEIVRLSTMKRAKDGSYWKWESEEISATEDHGGDPIWKGRKIVNKV